MHSVRTVFAMMPRTSDPEWANIAARVAAVPAAYAGYTETLRVGLGDGILAGARQVHTAIIQLTEWLDSGYFAGVVKDGPEPLRAELDAAAQAADAACRELREFLELTYSPAAANEPDTCGRARYTRAARQWTGSEVDLDEAYAWAWTEFHRLDAELHAEAEKVRPGATPAEAMAWLNTDGDAVDGEEAIRARLQQMMDTAIAELDGTHFDLADQVKVVEAKIAPVGGAAAPYYTRPSLDFVRPGRTWLPAMGRTRFPLWDLTSTWYHEGVPGHHLQLAQWTLVAPQLSKYQTSIGSVGANVEGWALYAERLMDELGYLRTPGERIGYLDAQQMSGPGDRGHRHALRHDNPRRRRVPRGRGLDPGAGAGVPRAALRPRRRVPGLRADPLPRDARAGHQLQARRAGVAAGPGRGAGRPGGRLRPQALAHGRPLAGLPGPG